ncbi:hypothetical protein [Agrobacterium sp.]|uniref:hypothetical protein n=1 Tax=Agrobacterium sp. TaxID=361 RepID=UPI0028A6C903
MAIRLRIQLNASLSHSVRSERFGGHVLASSAGKLAVTCRQRGVRRGDTLALRSTMAAIA